MGDPKKGLRMRSKKECGGDALVANDGRWKMVRREKREMEGRREEQKQKTVQANRLLRDGKTKERTSLVGVLMTQRGGV